MAVLITGGAGFIGSTIATRCKDQGIEPVIVDDLSTGLKQFTNGRTFYQGQVGDRELLRKILAENDIEAIIHCAAKIVVPESTQQPLSYYENNISQGIVLLEEAIAAGVKAFVFSSSGSIYSAEDGYEFNEDTKVDPHSPYSQTKADFERLLKAVAASSDLQVVSLRYFNPIGCDPQYRTGLQIEHPSHVLGKILEKAADKTTFTVTGVDWPTRDGSGVRDYIHVWDLAAAHLAVLDNLSDIREEDGTFSVINVGTGDGTTVRELVDIANTVLPEPIESQDGPARPGDVVGGFANVDKSKRLLKWEAKLSIQQGVADSLEWSKRLASVLADENYAPDLVAR
ncbi:UDP-glucose 4-epimerase GalE [Corynebacterium felinum]|uniref:UDP-glucose 4-epimerase n=1 Tax=Corynebacterium felinum TaxID=131318 RepID=A0ABU2BC47_9CORY|nr:UDP-glucose 4-epimerase GalE [Corynebacterium felinum]MDF5819915.1 UDP-glucose 4-epimerase GalE [Corynebacterium felinum]MDR7355941.1 UDP-glucose 4-epimerase [Corynebacterium felinum]WJY95279.1 UDP-glucose 4-epimerase [Corynebacterium felinum]